MNDLQKHAFLTGEMEPGLVATDPAVILERVCEAMKGVNASPQTLSEVFMRLGVSVAVQNKCDDVTWGQLKRSVLRYTNESFDLLAKGVEARRPGA